MRDETENLRGVEAKESIKSVKSLKSVKSKEGVLQSCGLTVEGMAIRQ